MVSEKKILLTTAYINGPHDYYDWAGTNIKWKNRLRRLRKISYALRFIKANLPQIEIMEYPTWEAYEKKLEEGWDIVGFSFYLNEVDKINRMIEHTRDAGVSELWGGNYGVLTDGMEKKFDRVFIGYAEQEIARILNIKLERIKHPPLINSISFNSLELANFGTLFTTRGCTHKCKFCQTPVFDAKSEVVPLESLEEVLVYYKSRGINNVGIFDENFGLIPRHARDVAKLLNKYDFTWACMARADFVARNVDEWASNGGKFAAAGVGIESFNSEILSDVKKRTDAEKILANLSKIKSRGVGILGYYIIGFPNETADSIKIDMKKLAALKNEMNQVTILTPLPKTPLWYELDENYGIFEKDYSLYDTKHLVWNHPEIGKDELERLLDSSLRLVNPRSSMFRILFKYFEKKASEGGPQILSRFVKNIYRYNHHSVAATPTEIPISAMRTESA
ncbi:MAG: radical SAM protein [Thermoplasmata archaeon]|nr:MAG: radical SAM protein [Thermoplasmata archaeon]